MTGQDAFIDPLSPSVSGFSFVVGPTVPDLAGGARGGVVATKMSTRVGFSFRNEVGDRKQQDTGKMILHSPHRLSTSHPHGHPHGSQKIFLFLTSHQLSRVGNTLP